MEQYIALGRKEKFNEQVKTYIDKYPSEIIEMYLKTGYKITPKGMLQIYLKQDIPSEVLKQIFLETFKS